VPLKKSARKSAIGPNLKLLRKEGYPAKQALAIALNTQRRAKKRNAAKGGKKAKRKGK
jgi:hypothetical protein